MLKPLVASKWNFTTAAHLLNRAGFGGTPAEIEQLVKLGPDKAVAQFVDYKKIPDDTTDPEWAKPDPTRGERLMALRRATMEQRKVMQREENQKQRQRIQELRSWWLERMAKGPRPLQEKLTLFWHGHFATSFQKVKDSYLMWRQNDTFRHHADGNWKEMLLAVTKDPAMLIWLDQAQSRKEHPNENYAREVMELFTLGEGHYTEQDVTEAARALTGWSMDRISQECVYRPMLHDGEEKVFLGRKGNLTGTDVLDQIVAQPQAAHYIIAKLWAFFASENPPPELIDALTAEFRRSGDHFKPVLHTMFRCEEFYSDTVIRNQVKSPTQWLVSSVRMLERELPPPMSVTTAMRQLGQDLFAPPNVKGWDGGISWITTSNLLNRYNFGALLVMGRSAIPMMADRQRANRMRERLNRLNALNRPTAPVDVNKVFTKEERRDKESLLAALERRFLQSKVRDKQADALREFLNSQKELNGETVLNAVRLIMSTPEFQLT